MKWLTVFMLCVFMGTSLMAQVQAIDDFVESHNEPEFEKYFVYQSYLRMLNTDGNEDFNKLIKDVDKVIAYIAQGSSNVTTEDYNSLIQSLEDDDFEVLGKAKYDGALIQVVAQFSGEDSKFVVAVLSDKDFALLEMYGQLDLRYLTAFKDVDFMQLGEYILSQDGDSNNEQEGQPEEKTEEKTEDKADDN